MTKRTRRKWTPKRFSLKLIEESDLAYCLYFAFLNMNIEPGIFLGTRTRNDAITDGERAFMLASIKKAIMDGDVPIKAKNFSKNNTNSGGAS